MSGIYIPFWLGTKCVIDVNGLVLVASVLKVEVTLETLPE